ncbi:hypothetical protein QEH59_16850 [Coraliomargarita sp. SDUM461004]|uniref:PEP-CTERM sorting domain-containing protein n=1 Tax=Thalassobacterium sedimentorum TaxID=3041258 RepID=A0ABU1AMU1_9BACT|nr:hypothetical protein [Coraliomargarita sp. SDUM461004]
MSSLQAQSLVNTGFEEETFGTAPGYISSGANGSITGWTANDNSRVGLNSTGPFSNNGAVPEGSQVAFVQAVTGSSNTLTSASGITGLTAGKTYRITYRVNSRISAGNNSPEMRLVVGGSTAIRGDVTSVGGANPYKTVSYDFVATASTASLAIDAAVSGGGTDETLLLDDFTVSEVTPRISVNAWNGDATSGITTAGGRTYSHAYNFGGGASNVDINGVTFTGVAGGNPSVAGQFSYNMGSAFGADVNNVTGSSADLAEGFVFGNENATLTLEGLTDGQTYILSIFTVGFDADGFGRISTITASDGELLTVDVNQFGNNNGLRVDYEYVANGTSETISLNALNTDAFHTYGFANAAIPEPSSFALFVGMLVLSSVLIRRRA